MKKFNFFSILFFLFFITKEIKTFYPTNDRHLAFINLLYKVKNILVLFDDNLIKNEILLEQKSLNTLINLNKTLNNDSKNEKFSILDLMINKNNKTLNRIILLEKIIDKAFKDEEIERFYFDFEGNLKEKY